MTDLLTTERLVLRRVTVDDHAWLLAHWTTPDVRRFLFDGELVSAAEVAAAAAHPLWLVLENGEDPAGTAGLRPLDDLGFEIYYSLAPSAWGRGYATEAAAAVLAHALGPMGLSEVFAEVDEGNTASVAVIERLGMTPFATVPGELGTLTRYRTR